ncbi:hypothetical protein EPN81_01960 [Patescibacteria group bacterium]|nr:MAG: hypothetical protein EPN81_01960 [Patescibacteria group bacterium]
MRYSIPFLFMVAVVALAGCTTLHHQDPKTGLEVTYTGPASDAVELVHATDPRPFEMAQQAMEEGMVTSLARDADGDVRFQAGYPYSGYSLGGNVGGYAQGNVGFVPGQGFVVGPPISTLPPLSTQVVVGVSAQTGDGAIVPCPKDRKPRTVAEQAACALLSAKTALERSDD